MQTQCPKASRRFALSATCLLLALASITALSVRINRASALTQEQAVQAAIAQLRLPSELHL